MRILCGVNAAATANLGTPKHRRKNNLFYYQIKQQFVPHLRTITNTARSTIYNVTRGLDQSNLPSTLKLVCDVPFLLHAHTHTKFRKCKYKFSRTHIDVVARARTHTHAKTIVTPTQQHMHTSDATPSESWIQFLEAHPPAWWWWCLLIVLAESKISAKPYSLWVINSWVCLTIPDSIERSHLILWSVLKNWLRI